MTVSQLVYDLKRIDASINLSEFKNEKKSDNFKNKEMGYNFNDPGFKALMMSVCLSTVASFTTKLEDKVIKEQMKKAGIQAEDDATVAKFKQEFEEKLKEFDDTEKFVLGDASETGLVRFANQTVLGGNGDLERVRGMF
jgi:hypothetical protein